MLCDRGLVLCHWHDNTGKNKCEFMPPDICLKQETWLLAPLLTANNFSNTLNVSQLTVLSGNSRGNNKRGGFRIDPRNLHQKHFRNDPRVSPTCHQLLHLPPDRWWWRRISCRSTFQRSDMGLQGLLMWCLKNSCCCRCWVQRDTPPRWRDVNNENGCNFIMSSLIISSILWVILNTVLPHSKSLFPLMC